MTPREQAVHAAKRALIQALNPDVRLDAAFAEDPRYVDSFLRTMLQIQPAPPQLRRDEVRTDQPDGEPVDLESARQDMMDDLERQGGASDRRIALSRKYAPRGRRAAPGTSR